MVARLEAKWSRMAEAENGMMIQPLVYSTVDPVPQTNPRVVRRAVREMMGDPRDANAAATLNLFRQAMEPADLGPPRQQPALQGRGWAEWNEPRDAAPAGQGGHMIVYCHLFLGLQACQAEGRVEGGGSEPHISI